MILLEGGAGLERNSRTILSGKSESTIRTDGMSLAVLFWTFSF
jgi:hypothetical protein